MKIKLHVQNRIPFEKILMFVAVFCVTMFALLENVSISIPLFSYVKMPLLYAGGICIITQIGLYLKVWKKKKYFYLFGILFILCIMLLLSAYNYQPTLFSDSPLRTTVRLVLYLLELFMVTVWVSEKERSKFVINFLFWAVFILTIATDLLLFTEFLLFSDGRFETYLVGTKFSVSYFHMNLLTLWFMRNTNRFYNERKAKWVIIFGMPMVTFVSIYVDCMTGVLGCVALLILFLLFNTPVQRKLLRLNSPILFTLCLGISVTFPFIAEQITSIPFVSYVLNDVFGRDSTLTGRLNIFEAFAREMDGHWLWGYGYGNGNVASVSLFGYANAQNALLHWVLQVGIPTTVLLIILMVQIFKQLSQSPNQMKAMPLAVLVYVYIALGTIETTFSMSFIMWIALIFMLSNDKGNV